MINPVLVSLITADLYGTEFSPALMGLFIYIAVSHLCFAFIEKR